MQRELGGGSDEFEVRRLPVRLGTSSDPWFEGRCGGGAPPARPALRRRLRVAEDTGWAPLRDAVNGAHHVRLGNSPLRAVPSRLLPKATQTPSFFSRPPSPTPPHKSPGSITSAATEHAFVPRAEEVRNRRAADLPRARGSDPAGEMLGGLLSKILLLLFGYAMPAFECFKTVEGRPNDAHMLRFWCQYWIIVAMVIAVEGLISWMPMYGEIKLAFFVYLWYPKTKGSDVVYDTFLRPIVMQYEPNIEQRLLHLRARSGQLISFYTKNFADKGTAFFMDVLRYVVSDKAEGSNLELKNKKSGWSPFATKRQPPSPPPQQESRFDNPDAAAVAEVLRAAINPTRRAHNGKDY